MKPWEQFKRTDGSFDTDAYGAFLTAKRERRQEWYRRNGKWLCIGGVIGCALLGWFSDSISAWWTHLMFW